MKQSRLFLLVMVLAAFFCMSSNPVSADLIGKWTFDGTDVLADSSGNGYNLSVYSGNAYTGTVANKAWFTGTMNNTSGWALFEGSDGQSFRDV